MKTTTKRLRPWRRTGEDRKCITCSKPFYVPKNEILSGRGKFCSRKCYEIDRKGKPMHPNTKKALSGLVPWSKGLSVSEDERLKRFSDAGRAATKPEPWNKGLRYGRANWIRLKDLNRYRNIHKRITRKFGKLSYCEDCKREDLKIYHWANLSGRYLVDRSDWRRLCPKCHMRMDKPNEQGKIYAQSIRR